MYIVKCDICKTEIGVAVSVASLQKIGVCSIDWEDAVSDTHIHYTLCHDCACSLREFLRMKEVK